jgi:hypothetical protein
VDDLAGKSNYHHQHLEAYFLELSAIVGLGSLYSSSAPRELPYTLLRRPVVAKLYRAPTCSVRASHVKKLMLRRDIHLPRSVLDHQLHQGRYQPLTYSTSFSLVRPAVTRLSLQLEC